MCVSGGVFLSVTIEKVKAKSAAEKCGIRSGETILRINGNEICDILDYRFYEANTRLLVELRDTLGKTRTVKIKKEEYDELGLEFETYLMDKEHSCRNRCVFCFIDQMPEGLRDTLYFKDDDARLSFLFGNYITLTNLGEREADRMIRMHISPINISVHTTNPELRCRMMGNRFAGESLQYLKRFTENGIDVNAQIVLCPGLNDGEELMRTFSDLIALGEHMKSAACVPVGLTRFREGLYPLSPFTKRDAENALSITDRMGEICLQKFGERRIYASDEIYLKAERPIPESDFYEDFPQYDNGVGMWADLRDSFLSVLSETELPETVRPLTVATGELAAPLLSELLAAVQGRKNSFSYRVIPVKNHFFGGTVTVAGLLTGQDFLAACKGNCKERLMIPKSALRFEGDLFLDDMPLSELQKELGVPVIPVKNGGAELLAEILEERE